MKRLTSFILRGIIAFAIVNTAVISIFLSLPYISAGELITLLQFSAIEANHTGDYSSGTDILFEILFIFVVVTIAPAIPMTIAALAFKWEVAANYIYFGFLFPLAVTLIFLVIYTYTAPSYISLNSEEMHLLVILNLILSAHEALGGFVFWIVARRHLPWIYY